MVAPWGDLLHNGVRVVPQLLHRQVSGIEITQHMVRTYLQTWPLWGLVATLDWEPASLGVPCPLGFVGLAMGLSEDGSIWRLVSMGSASSGFNRLWRWGGECTSGCLFLAVMGLDGRAVRGASGSGAARAGAGLYSSDIAIRI